MRRFTILIATDVSFWLEAQGSHQRILALTDFLRERGHDLHIAFSESLSAEATFFLGKLGYSIHDISPRLPKQKFFRKKAGQIGREVVRFLRRFGCFLPTFEKYSENSGNRFRTVVDQIKPDVIIIEYMRQAYLTSFLDEDVRRRTKYLIDTHDVISERCQVLSELGLWSFAPVTAENERNALSVADAIIAIQSHDARKFQALLPTSEVLVAMHPVQARYVSLPCEMDDSNIALGFLGSTNEPNVEAIKDLIAAIYPAVRARTKRRVTLLVAGQVCDAFRKKYAREYAARPEGVEFLGFLTDPEEFYRRTDIVVNPVSCGSGLKIKCVEGLARARPVVTTPIGAEGLEIAIGHGLFVSPTVEHFAQHVLQLIDDPNLLRRSSSQAYDFAEEHLSANAVFRSLEEWINCNCGDSPVLQVASSSH